MHTLKLIASKSFTSMLYEQGSWGARRLGMTESSMDLFQVDGDDTRLEIEWDIPAAMDCEHIGLTVETHEGRRTLVDFDGVMELPAQAVDMLEAQGIVVDDEFKE